MKKIYNLHQSIKIGVNYWKFLDSLLEYLKIYEEATRILSNTLYPSISLMFIVIKKLFEETNKWKVKQTYTEINKCSTCIHSKLSKYWSELKVFGLISTYLDPRFKNLILKIFPNLKSKIKQLYNEYNDKNDKNISDESIISSESIFFEDVNDNLTNDDELEI